MSDGQHQPAVITEEHSHDEDDGGVRRPLLTLVVVVAAGVGLILALTLIERHLGPSQAATAATVAGSRRTPDQPPAQPP